MAKKRKRSSAPAKPYDLDNPSVLATVTEWLEVEDWIEELGRHGYDEFYSRRTRQRRLPHGAKDFPKWLRQAFPNGGPDLIAVSRGRRKIIVGDPTGDAATGTNLKPGDLRKLPNDIGESETQPHLKKTRDDAEKLARHLPEELKDVEVVAQDRYRQGGQKVSREIPVYKNGRFLRPSAAKSAATLIDDTTRGIAKSGDDFSRAIRNQGTHASHFVGPTELPKDWGAGRKAKIKARSLALGVKGWRAVRTIGKVIVLCIVPLSALDVVMEVAFALWDRAHEKEEKQRRQKQKALEVALKHEGGQNVSQLIQNKILNNSALFDEYVRVWDMNRNSAGFLYARLSAEIHIESHRNPMNYEIEELTNYKVASLDILPTTYMHEFEFSNIGEDKEIQQPPSDNAQQALLSKTTRKFVQRKRLKYTIVPPMYTPFDIIVTKMNNLFLDIVSFILECGGSGQFGEFNYKGGYEDQFETALQIPSVLNESACRYCLSYLHWAAGRLSEHPLREQDLEGNLEDSRKGWKRRFWLLNDLLEAGRTKHKKNFSYVAEKVNELVRAGSKNEELRDRVIELYAGARAIWYDLNRIESSIGKPEYYYFGPSYIPPRES